MRELGIPSALDRLIQQAVLQVLQKSVDGHRNPRRGAPVYESARDDGESYYLGHDLEAWGQAIAAQLVERGAHGPEAVAWLRKGCRLSQEAAGELLGVNRNTVRRWESGESAIPVAFWVVLAMLFKRRKATERLLRAAHEGPGSIEAA